MQVDAGPSRDTLLSQTESKMPPTELQQCLDRVISRVDEIMQQEVRPLLAVDIIEQLHRRFAVLSGGRGRDGAPIITLPECSGFSELPDQDFLSVITYLTSIPSQEAASIGFIIVIDRRRDKWTSVKASLARIAGAFPGNLQLVLVLRPSRFFQRAMADIGIRLHRDDFKMKVVMLSSLSDLHIYVDKGQLTSELGGNLDYCHSQWIHHRTAIESFAVAVKGATQKLQKFSAELSGVELPVDVHGAQELLCAHTARHDGLQDDLHLAVRQGATLLCCIKEAANRTASGRLNPDERENLDTVERLVSQLDETKASLEQCWSKHHRKLEQCLQFRQFEQDCLEVKKSLDAWTEELDSISDVGSCMTAVEEQLSGVKAVKERAQESLARAQRHVVHGDQLIEDGHYAVHSIESKCSELRRVCGYFSDEVKRKCAVLEKFLRIHQQVDKVNKWCESGMYLLASQAVDRCQSQEGAEAALRDVESFIETVRKEELTSLRDLHAQCDICLPVDLEEKLQKALERLDEVQEMFEKRQASLKKLSAKQARPVQPVAPHPESSPKHPPASSHRTSEIPGFSKLPADADASKRRNLRKTKGGIKIEVMHEASQGGLSHILVANDTEESLFDRRRHIMNELIETERLYVEELQSIMEGYVAKLGKADLSHPIPPVLENNQDVLFGNLSEIYDFHNRTFRKELENCIENPELVGACFLKRKEDLQMYEKYCQNKPRSEALWRQCVESSFFQECQKKLDHKLSLDAYLLKPVQRITKYQLMLKEMLKCSTNSEDTAQLQEALATMLDIIKSVNDSMHQIAITGFSGNLNNLGKLLMQGSFSVWTEHKKGHSKVKDLARFKPRQRHLFLYSSMLLFCKRREDSTDNHERTPSYSFKHSLKMSEVGITENVKGDSRKFEVWCNGREEVYIIQAPSTDMKNMWVSEMRKVLTEQLEACREARQLHQRVTDHIYPPLLNVSIVRATRKVAPRKLVPSRSEPGGCGRGCGPGGEWQLGEPPRRRHTHTEQDHKNLRSLDMEDLEIIRSSTEELSNTSEEETVSKYEDCFRVQMMYENAVAAQYLTVGPGDVVQFLEEAASGQWLVKNLVTQKTGLVPPRILGGFHEYSDIDVFSDMCSAALTDTEEADEK
ncbi:guanine nucleotide exchange factor DBS isoform X2 [Paramormyrops kingsleyae]|uniref:guanine nucleotide exchange factor DBS isoform X2 n=1 Tax=Paramormyrops kingsleyae TaxID=1676925 RepID=UPI003B97A764